MLEKILTSIGGLGFISVFQLIGVWGLYAVWTGAKKSLNGQRFVKDLAGFIGGTFFSLWFTILPLFMIYEMGGLPLMTIQMIILGILITFVATPHPKQASKEEGSKQAEPENKGIKKSLIKLGNIDAALLETSAGTAYWSRMIPALTCFGLAVCYIAALLGSPVGGMTKEWLSLLVKVQFLVIHSFPFLALITLPRLEMLRWRIFQWFLFCTWFCLYLAFAVADEHGIGGIIAFMSGTLATYLGFILRTSDEKQIFMLGKRWITSFVVFILSAILFDSGNWQVSNKILYHGTVYFIVLGILELTGVYEMDWKALLQSLKEKAAAIFSRHQGNSDDNA